MPLRSGTSGAIDVEAVLRSVNLRMDATEPRRISHFQPTSKSIALIDALLGREESRAWLVTAPYGTGKSLTATYLLHLVENRPGSRDTLQAIERRLRYVSPKLANFGARRRRGGAQGLTIVLEGYEPNLPLALQRATLDAMDRLKLGRQARPLRGRKCHRLDESLDLLEAAQRKAREGGCDRMAILWDEFGRHLESLIAEARPGALADVQALAEYVDRSSELPTTLGLLLHQSLLQYADRASQSVRKEWAKIEGRFAAQQYVDDSQELYRLLGAVVNSRGSSTGQCLGKQAFQRAAERARELGYFTDWQQEDLAGVLERAYPLEPTTLALLPRLSARVAQNERTLFAFLGEMPLDTTIGPNRLYNYFSPAMRADTGVGGTYRRWLETESALSKTDGSTTAAQALKAACLLGLGVSGERARASYEAVVFAVAGYEDDTEARATVDELIEHNLLLHRRHNDQIAVWHGTDLDLRRRLEEVKAREQGEFRLEALLADETPPPVWKPVAYNDVHNVRRYLAGDYRAPTELGAYLDFEQHFSPLRIGEDGRVLYMLAEDNGALEQALYRAKNDLTHERVVVAVPRESLPLADAALEVWCLRRLQHQPEILREDPLAGAELEQLTDDARAHLQRLMDRVTWPSSSGPRWFYRGQELGIGSPRALRQRLSEIMREVYPDTPDVRNEMINRHHPSRVLVNARKKVVLGVLERAGTPDLGIHGQTPDASIYRALLARTGLYRQSSDGAWSFARPDEIVDPGLQQVWRRMHAFFTEPADEPKEPEALFDELVSSPYGVRRGLLPVLFAAAYRAFPSATAITREGGYLDDVLPSHIEDIVRKPGNYRVRVLALTTDRLDYLQGLYNLFASDTAALPREGDLIRACHDAIASWQSSLPPAALTSREIDKNGQGLQQVLVANSEPVQMLLERLPCACGDGRAAPAALSGIRHAKDALEQVATQYVEQAALAIGRILSLRAPNGHNVRETAIEWANCFPDTLVERLPERRLSGLVSRLRASYALDAQLVDSLAHLLIGQSVKQWDDASLVGFERELDAAARRIEEIALSSRINLEQLGPQASGLAVLARERMAQWHARFRELVGATAAARTLQELESNFTTNGPVQENAHGNCKRRAQ